MSNPESDGAASGSGTGHPASNEARIYSEDGNVMNGEYEISVHLASDRKVFCLLDDDGERCCPGNIEYIESEMGLAEVEEFGEAVFEDVLTREPNRTDEPPTIGKAVYDDGVMTDIWFDFDGGDV